MATTEQPLDELAACFGRMLRLSMRLGRVQALQGLADAARSNPTANLLDLIEGAIQYERMVHAAERDRRGRVE